VLWDTFFAYDAATTYNPAFWTMEKEFIGSLFLFASLLLFGSARKRLLVYPVTAFCLTLLGLHWVTSFLAGMALCDLYVHRENNPVGNDAHWTYRTGARLLDNRAVAAMSVMAIAVLVGLPNYGKVLHLIVASMLVPLCLLSKPLRSLLSSRPVAFLGRISFGLYLVHVPLICSFSCWLYLKIGPELGRLWGSLICCAVTIPLALVAGWLLHLAGDRPGLRLASRIPALVNRITG
jgi:peptidoglycan/LPS O-acetylase OafA/YrhL